MKWTINSINGNVMFEVEAETFLKAVEQKHANLCSADLRSANLRSADLRSANLRYADLRYANLCSADLRSADLSYANLSSANLSSANLRYANLSSADLSYADLSYANLRYADLRSADLSYANLRSADLSYAKTKLSDLLKSNSIATLLQQYWGNLPDDLCLEMMRHDAESCGIEAMDNWAKTGKCPFANSVRDYFFIENKSLWKEGKPKLRGIELLKALWIAKDGKL